MDDKSYLLDIVTPEKKVFSGKVEFAVFPGAEGELGVLCNHAPLLSRLVPGEIRITHNKNTECLAISGGFLEVRKNEVSVLAETAEFGNQINKGLALAEKQSAEAELKTAEALPEMKAAKLRLQKALARIKVAEKTVSTPQEKH